MLALKHRPLDLEGLDLEPLGEGRCLAVMDGECAVCSWGARTLARHDRADRIRITTIQSSLGRALCERAGLSPDDPDSWLVIEAGQAYTHASAVLRLSRHLSGPWSVLGRHRQIKPLLSSVY